LEEGCTPARRDVPHFLLSVFHSGISLGEACKIVFFRDSEEIEHKIPQSSPKVFHRSEGLLACEYIGMETTNAKIKEAFLGYEGHGILTIDFVLDYGGSQQGFGGYQLSNPYDLHRWITELMKTVGVESWNELKNKYVRVEREAGWNGKITRIGNLLEDKWFNPKP